MKKIPFSKLKKILLKEELKLMDQIEKEDEVDMSEDRAIFKEDFNNAANVEDLVAIFMDMGHDYQSAYECILNKIIDIDK